MNILTELDLDGEGDALSFLNNNKLLVLWTLSEEGPPVGNRCRLPVSHRRKIAGSRLK